MKTSTNGFRPFPHREYSRRMDRLAARLRHRGVEACLVTSETNRLYLTGFQSTNGLLVLQADGARAFYTDFRYLEMARAALPDIAVKRLKHLPGESSRQIAGLARRQGWKHVGYEGRIPTSRYHELKVAARTVKDWEDIESDLRELRACKSPREQAVLRRAVRIGDAVFGHLLEELRPGMTEWNIRCRVRDWADRLAQGESFATISCVGANASRCHHKPGDQRLRRNQELLIDMGVLVDGYRSDLTRTVFLGRPSKKLERVYAIVLEANRKAIRATRSGRTCGEIDAVARRVIEKAGYGKRFGHGLGHAVGLEIHEDPRFAPEDKTVLKPGMVMTVEPGIYLPGVGGVRIEDVVIVRRNGCEMLTRAPKELTVL